MSVLLWPMQFAAQPCAYCGEPVEVADSVALESADGKVAGFAHPDCHRQDEK